MNVNKLPIEVVSIIMRFLDGRSLTNASRVNKLWCEICKKDPILRIRIKRQELKRRKIRWHSSKPGDVTFTNTRICKLSPDVILKRKIRFAKYKLLVTLRRLKDLWQEFHDNLLTKKNIYL